MSWNASAAGPASPFTMGAFATGSGSAQLVLGAASAGAAPVAGGVGFALVAPLSPVLSTLVADGPAYLATVLVSTALALVGVVAYRRRAAPAQRGAVGAAGGDRSPSRSRVGRKRITSLMDAVPVSAITIRSTPIPTPVAGGMPNRSASTKSAS